MRHLGEKETISVTIDGGQSTKSVVFVEAYSVAPKVLITETNGSVNAATNVTILGCDIGAINSKVDAKANTDGRVVKLSIIE